MFLRFQLNSISYIQNGNLLINEFENFMYKLK